MSKRHSQKEKEILARKIKEYREKNNLTQEELADMIKVSVFSISRWERAKHYPPASTLKLMKMLGVL